MSKDTILRTYLEELYKAQNQILELLKAKHLDKNAREDFKNQFTNIQNLINRIQKGETVTLSEIVTTLGSNSRFKMYIPSENKGKKLF